MNSETKQSKETGFLRLIWELNHQPRASFVSSQSKPHRSLSSVFPKVCPALQSQAWRCGVWECHAGSPPLGFNQLPAHPALSLLLTLRLLSVHFNSWEGWASGAMPKVGKHLWGESLNVSQAPGQQDAFLAASQAKKWRQSHTTFYQMKMRFYS